MKSLNQLIYRQSKYPTGIPYKSWHVRATDSVTSLFTFRIIRCCNIPADKVSRILLVTWIPISAKGYHGSEMSTVREEPDSWTSRCAKVGYVIQKECNCLSPKSPAPVSELGKRVYRSPENLFLVFFLGSLTLPSLLGLFHNPSHRAK
jgi:hypothetical protein